MKIYQLKRIPTVQQSSLYQNLRQTGQWFHDNIINKNNNNNIVNDNYAMIMKMIMIQNI